MLLEADAGDGEEDLEAGEEASSIFMGGESLAEGSTSSALVSLFLLLLPLASLLFGKLLPLTVLMSVMFLLSVVTLLSLCSTLVLLALLTSVFLAFTCPVASPLPLSLESTLPLLSLPLTLLALALL